MKEQNLLFCCLLSESRLPAGRQGLIGLNDCTDLKMPAELKYNDITKKNRGLF